MGKPLNISSEFEQSAEVLSAHALYDCMDALEFYHQFVKAIANDTSLNAPIRRHAWNTLCGVNSILANGKLKL